MPVLSGFPWVVGFPTARDAAPRVSGKGLSPASIRWRSRFHFVSYACSHADSIGILIDGASGRLRCRPRWKTAIPLLEFSGVEHEESAHLARRDLAATSPSSDRAGLEMPHLG